MEDTEIINRLAAVEQRAVSNTRRIDKLEQSNEALNEMAGSVKLLCFQMEQSNKKIDNIETKVTMLESAPAKAYSKLLWIVVTALVGTLVGAAITYFLK